MPQLPDTDTAHQAALATGKLVVAFGTPLFGLITSLLSNVEAWLRIANLTVTLIVGICAFISWLKKNRKP